MVDQNLGGLLEGVLGEDGAVGGDFDDEFLVVGLLVDAEVFNCVLDVLDRGVNRVYGQGLDVGDFELVLVGGHPATAFVDCDLEVEARVGIQVTDDLLGIEDFKARKGLSDVTGFEHLLARHVDGSFLGLGIFGHLLEVHLLEIEDDICHILFYAGDGIELVFHAVNLDGGDGIALE